MIKQKSKRSFVEIVLDEVLHEFDEGLVKPGQRINAAYLSEKLGISRGPVREALHILAGRGLILLQKDRGAVLRPMSRVDILQLWDVLEYVGGIGVRTAADYVHAKDNAEKVRAAMSKIDGQCRTERTFRLYFAMNAFHYLLNDITGNPHINETLDKMNIPYWNRYLAEYINLERTAKQYAENYRRITESVLAGDGPTAYAAYSFHVRWSKEQILKGK